MADNLHYKLLSLLLGSGDSPKVAQQKQALIEAIADAEKVAPTSKPDFSSHKEELGKIFEVLQKKNSFRPGDIVKWKPRLRNRVYPDIDQPAIVIEMLEPPIRDLARGESGSLYFQELLDIRVGVILPGTGDLAEYLLPSKRLEPY